LCIDSPSSSSSTWYSNKRKLVNAS
jgi:hypothetical protein